MSMSDFFCYFRNYRATISITLGGINLCWIWSWIPPGVTIKNFQPIIVKIIKDKKKRNRRRNRLKFWASISWKFILIYLSLFLLSSLSLLCLFFSWLWLIWKLSAENVLLWPQAGFNSRFNINWFLFAEIDGVTALSQVFSSRCTFLRDRFEPEVEVSCLWLFSLYILKRAQKGGLSRLKVIFLIFNITLLYWALHLWHRFLGLCLSKSSFLQATHIPCIFELPKNKNRKIITFVNIWIKILLTILYLFTLMQLYLSRPHFWL